MFKVSLYVTCFGRMCNILTCEGKGDVADGINQSFLSDLDVFLLFQPFSSFSEHLPAAFWVLSPQCWVLGLFPPPLDSLSSPAVLSIPILGLSPQIPTSSWSLDMASVTPTSLAWHLGHGGGDTLTPLFVLLPCPCSSLSLLHCVHVLQASSVMMRWSLSDCW